MKRAFLLIILLSLSAISCELGSGLPLVRPVPTESEPVPSSEITGLLCGSQADCAAVVCEGSENCSLLVALSDRAVFNFVKTYSACDGCNTPLFPIAEGIGKCVEYAADETAMELVVRFWVSDECKFRYSDPTQAWITVFIDKEYFQILSIYPTTDYILDPGFCNTDADCRCLSGSGVPFIGCRNFLHAPLNSSGYYSGAKCFCSSHACTAR